MLVRVDWYKRTGKWAYGARVEIAPEPWESGIVNAVIQNQDEIVKDWWVAEEMYMVISDIPESTADPNYRMSYARLYTPQQISERAQGK